MSPWSIPLQLDVALHPDELKALVSDEEFQEQVKRSGYQTQWHEGREELSVRGESRLGSTRPLYRAHIVSGTTGSLLDGTVTPSKSHAVDITFSILAGLSLVTAIAFWGAEGDAERGVWAFGIFAALFAGVPLFNRLMASDGIDEVMFQIEVDPLKATLEHLLAAYTARDHP